jgi:flavin-dependent dehydrogenase
VCIIGGGLSGLALSLDLRKKGYSVIIIEKGSYPRHKVCGEYLSKESVRYLFDLCPEIKDIELPGIKLFKLSSTGKAQLSIPLEMGGLGISRFQLEMIMFRQAMKEGVVIVTDTKAEVSKQENGFFITRAGKEAVRSRIICNAAGRYAGQRSERSTRYVGVKYHVRLDRDPSFIEIHNFSGGYCGISNVENGISCLCYIINSQKIKENNNSIVHTEQKVLYQNKRLEHIFQNAEYMMEEPVKVSGIDFEARQPFHRGVFYLGDAAGTIAPITGNGMSMGLRSAMELSKIIDGHLTGEHSLEGAGKLYSGTWKKQFHSRIILSRYFHGLSEYPFLTRAFITGLRPFPIITSRLVKSTHGQPF